MGPVWEDRENVTPTPGGSEGVTLCQAPGTRVLNKRYFKVRRIQQGEAGRSEPREEIAPIQSTNLGKCSSYA